ncbi:MAG: beta-propeller fold lactonase family protein [Coraliomargarita sp.]|nr:beta-propeller fold lactonase family protein [Coraliomargarita sp.]
MSIFSGSALTNTGCLAFVSDLANNRIYSFSLNPDTGELVMIGITTSDSFLGPRHLILNRDESLLYTLNQRGSSA